MDIHELWQRAKHIPAMNAYDLEKFMIEDGFQYELDMYLLLKPDDVKEPGKIVTSLLRTDGTEAGVLLDKGMLKNVVVPTLMAGLQNPFFLKRFDTYQLAALFRYSYYVDDRNIPFYHDISDLANAPVHSAQAFEAWLNTGWDIELGLLYNGMWELKDGNPSPEVQFNSERVGFTYTASLPMLMNPNRLEEAYKSYMKLLERFKEWKKTNNSDGAASYIWMGFDTNMYTNLWGMLIDKFGTDEAYEWKKVSPHTKFCSWTPNDFPKWLSVWEGDAENFLCGTDTKLGFDEDLRVTANAIEAKHNGKEYFVDSVCVDLYNGDYVKVRMRVDEVLSYARLGEMAKAVAKGITEAPSIDPVAEDELYKQYKKLGFFDYESDSYMNIVYPYLLTELKPDDIPESEKHSEVSRLLTKAAGDLESEVK